MEQALEKACGASTKTQMSRMKDRETTTEKNQTQHLFRCTVTRLVHYINFQELHYGHHETLEYYCSLSFTSLAYGIGSSVPLCVLLSVMPPECDLEWKLGSENRIYIFTLHVWWTCCLQHLLHLYNRTKLSAHILLRYYLLDCSGLFFFICWIHCPYFLWIV